jgi:hypothetical protein
MSEWLDEPDREEFEHAGLKCLIFRTPELGNLCGYAGVSKGHVCYGIDGESLPYEDLSSVSVHGGLTFSGQGEDPWRPVGYWWLGFDCAHYMDLVPQMYELELEWYGKARAMEGTTYRNFEYVRKETKHLAEQLGTLEFIDWQLKWVWPLLLPVRAARRIWRKNNSG